MDQLISQNRDARPALARRKLAMVVGVLALLIAGGAFTAGTAQAAPGGYQAVHGRAFACGGDRPTGLQWWGNNGDSGWTPIVNGGFAFHLRNTPPGGQWVRFEVTCFRPWNRYVTRSMLVPNTWGSVYIAV